MKILTVYTLNSHLLTLRAPIQQISFEATSTNNVDPDQTDRSRLIWSTLFVSIRTLTNNRRVAGIQIFEKKTDFIVLKDETGLKFKINVSTLFRIGSYAIILENGE